MPVFSQMRNLFDMSIVAAFMHQNDFYGKANWDLGVLADEEKLSTRINNGISQVEPARQRNVERRNAHHPNRRRPHLGSQAGFGAPDRQCT